MDESHRRAYLRDRYSADELMEELDRRLAEQGIEPQKGGVKITVDYLREGWSVLAVPPEMADQFDGVIGGGSIHELAGELRRRLLQAGDPDQFVEREIGALLAALGERLSEEAEPARAIHLQEELTAFGVSKDQEGVTWLTCVGNPVLNLEATFRKIVSQDGRIELPGGAVVQLCDGCEKNKAGCVSVGEEVLCADCCVARGGEFERQVKELIKSWRDLSLKSAEKPRSDALRTAAAELEAVVDPAAVS